MKKTLISLAVFLGLALSAFGQTALTQTTLSAAVTPSATSIPLTSATGVTAGQTVLYVDQEAMYVNSLAGKVAGVTRGYQGTRVGGHISLATVLLGPPPAFISYDPQGACTAGKELPYAPMINLSNGNQWLCSSITKSIVPGFGTNVDRASVTAAVASAAGATLPSGPLFHVTGTNAITAWGSSTTLGAVGMGGGSSNSQGAPFCAIPDAIFTTTATNNIALATTAVVNKMLCFTFDATNKKYVPSY